MTTPAERVRRGAALLDMHFEGREWRERLDIAHLNLAGGSSCVLGQVFPELCRRIIPAYYLAMHELGLAGRADGVAHGFHYVEGDDWFKDCDALKAEWAKQAVAA